MTSLKKKCNTIPLNVKISAAYAMCNILQKCLGLISLPLFTRMLTTEQYGQATIYASWSSVLTILITLQLPYGSFSTAMIKFEEKRNEYIASLEGICLLLALVFLILYLPCAGIWNKLFELPTYIMLLMVVEIVANSGIAFWSGKKRFEFKYKEIVYYTLISSIFSVVIQFLLVINSDEKGYARIIGGATVSILTGGYLFVRNLVKGGKIFEYTFWKYALGFNIPLLAYYFSQMIFNTSDRIMISHLVGTDKAAIYGVAYGLAIMLNFVLNAIYNSYIPWIYQKIKEGKQEENRIVSLAISTLMAILLLGIIWLTPEIIYVMADKEYREAIWIVPPVAMSVLLLFYAQLSISFEFYFEKKKMLVRSSVLAAIINIVLNAIFIPLLGYYVAGYTTLISYVLFALMNYSSLRQIMRENDISDHGFDVKRLCVLFLIFSVLGFLGMYLYNYTILRYVVILLVVVTAMINHNRLRTLLQLVRVR